MPVPDPNTKLWRKTVDGMILVNQWPGIQFDMSPEVDIRGFGLAVRSGIQKNAVGEGMEVSYTLK